MEKIIRELIEEGLIELYGISGLSFAVEFPGDMSHGDYATNVALVASKIASKSPKEIAQDLVSYIQKNKGDEIEKVSVAGPGFINFSFSREYFSDMLRECLEKGKVWGASSMHDGKTILVEHSSPNLFKPFHVGHIMNNAIGESVVRLALFSGADVKAISYPSDISLGVAKAIWAILEDGIGHIDTFKTDIQKIEYLGECYVRGTRAYEDKPELQSRIREIMISLYERRPGPELDAYEKGKELNLSYFKSITKRLGSSFDGYIYESEAGIRGLDIVKENVGKVFEESDGAIIYRGEQDNLHTRVFVNKEGVPTYEAKDIGLLSLKFSKYNPDISIFITDYQQEEYFKVVSAAAGKINSSWKDKTIHRTHGRMSFKGKKMSSRLGGVPTAQAVIDSVKDELREKSSDLRDELLEMIAVGAIKFSILRVQAGKNVNFDPDTSLSFEGDSGPYLQYTAVRAGSVLEKARQANLKISFSETSELTEIERMIARFPYVVQRSISEWAPHYLVTYLLGLAQEFNSWYGKVKIIDPDDKKTGYRLVITQALEQTIINGLSLLGIQTPERM